jgi:hypothetical protein
VQGSRRGKGWGGLGLRLGLGLGLGGQQKHPAQQRPGVPNLLPLPQSQLIKKTWAAVRAEAPASARGFGAGRPREMSGSPSPQQPNAGGPGTAQDEGIFGAEASGGQLPCSGRFWEDRETRRQGDKETSRRGDKETGRQGDRETARPGDKERSTSRWSSDTAVRSRHRSDRFGDGIENRLSVDHSRGGCAT